MAITKSNAESRIIRLLRIAPACAFRGCWRWGTRLIPCAPVDRLLASGELIRDGDTLRLADHHPRRPGHQDAAGAVA